MFSPLPHTNVYASILRTQRVLAFAAAIQRPAAAGAQIEEGGFVFVDELLSGRGLAPAVVVLVLPLALQRLTDVLGSKAGLQVIVARLLARPADVRARLESASGVQLCQV